MFKERIVDFIKGIIIGISNIMPGFSGGIMAVSFNVYDRIISAISSFFSHPLKVIKDIWAIALGGAVGIIIALLGISILLEHFPIPTIMLFTGLIVGSIPIIFDKVKAKRYKASQIIAFFMGIFIIIGLPLLTKEKTVIVLEVDLALLLTMFLLGIVAAATMVIPGVSGSLVLLAFGYYIYIVQFIKDFLTAIINFDRELFLANFSLVIALGLGIVFGAIGLSRLVEKLLSKWPKIVYSAILGLVTASPFAIIYQLFNPNDPSTENYRNIIKENLVLNLFIGIVFLTIGVILANYMTKFEKNHPTRSKEENSG
jgi:putative membrane protein